MDIYTNWIDDAIKQSRGYSEPSNRIRFLLSQKAEYNRLFPSPEAQGFAKQFDDQIELAKCEASTASPRSSQKENIIELSIREKVRDAFRFMRDIDPRKQKDILSEEDFDKLISWITFYFENKLALPEINKPIKNINTNKGNVIFAFKRFFQIKYPTHRLPESLFELIKGCFEKYSQDSISNMRKTKEPQHFVVDFGKAVAWTK